MFTGIIEEIGTILTTEIVDNKLYLTVKSAFTNELKVDQSVSHNGVCLTVTNINENTYIVCAVHETIEKTTIGHWKVNDKINLERGMIAGSRLDGHIVQGHVDTTGKCLTAKEENGNWQYIFSFPASFAALIIEKGSIVINGTSLTCYNIENNSFMVTIIPFTYENTCFQYMQEGDAVNLEFDVIGKYFQRHLSLAK